MPDKLCRLGLLCTLAQATLAPETLWDQTATGLHDPPGHSVLFQLRTLPTSVQLYTCKATAGSFAWSAPDPDAIVATADSALIIHHYKGPTWEATDGSIIHGGNAKHFPAPREKSVDWLELTATKGTLKFAKVAYIHRIDTSGGVAPPQPCDAANDQQQARVPYSATYVFYVPNN
jgi:hypothetical protein